ncbi:MAG: hypothetical protein KA210_10170 [Bacteroidia bacterium]|nr:hypothetical protein [Bacteroidia bacterium]
MKNLKLEIFQETTESGNTYLIYRYFDDKNNNYEYQTYKLVQSKNVARNFGISDTVDGRNSSLNTREMCNQIIKELEKK